MSRDPGNNNSSFDEMAFLQTIIDNIDAVIAVCDANKVVVMINRVGCTMLREDGGMEPEELLGQPIDAVLEPLIYDGTSIVGLVADQKIPLQRNVHYKRGDVNRTILYTAIPVIEDGVLRYIVATGRDLTRLIHLEEQLEQAQRLNEYYSGMVQRLKEYEKINEIIYSSKKMESILNLAARAAQSDAPVFITGESGVGKEIIARYIHDISPRKERPFIAINCAAIPKELIESELFGYVEGAFTGSRRGGKAGLLEEADGGTFFMDEIGDLPFDLQAKLLRVVQEGVMRRVGSTRGVEVNVRYISATNMNKEKLLNNSVFRQDLRYRLSVIPIAVPSIRERREDIIPIVEHFMDYFNKKYEKDVHLSAAAYDYLCRLPWQGNVRQIKNVVERIVILSENGYLLKEELLPIVQMDIDNCRCNDSVGVQTVKVSEIITLGEAYEQLERQLIDMAIKEHKTVSKAAAALGVPPSTIYRKLKKF